MILDIRAMSNIKSMTEHYQYGNLSSNGERLPCGAIIKLCSSLRVADVKQQSLFPTNEPRNLRVLTFPIWTVIDSHKRRNRQRMKGLFDNI